MLLQLHARALRPLGSTSPEPFIARLHEGSEPPINGFRTDVQLVRRGDAFQPGFRGYLFWEAATSAGGLLDAYQLAPPMHYLVHGDVVRIDPRRGTVSALYRRNSPSNTFLLTERCDNYCVMCSQPPRDRDDSWLVDELMQVLPLVSPETAEIGITGGEPTLLGDRFVALLAEMKRRLPSTAVHVLSNGRSFADSRFTQQVAAVRHEDLMIGIPLYSDLADEHDYVVQARGAYSETVRGILNLKRWGVRVEVRFVIHAETYKRLPEFARFLARNLLFVDHVALMGLEPIGFAKANLDALWVDPFDYQHLLQEAASTLERSEMPVSIYNHQLCTLPSELHSIARKSISDWKNMYVEACNGCTKRGQCGGFFASASARRSNYIQAFTTPDVSAASDNRTAGIPDST